VTPPDSLRERAEKMEKELRQMVIFDHGGSLISPAESRAAYIEAQLRAVQQEAWEEAAITYDAARKRLEGDVDDMEHQGDFEHDARHAYPLQVKAARTIALAALQAKKAE